MLVTCSLAVILPLALIFPFHQHLQKRSLDFTEDKKGKLQFNKNGTITLYAPQYKHKTKYFYRSIPCPNHTVPLPF